MLTNIELKNFTAFKELSVDFSQGINVFIGENGTGKTHILKLVYAACKFSKSEEQHFHNGAYSGLLVPLFKPETPEGLIHGKAAPAESTVTLQHRLNERKYTVIFSLGPERSGILNIADDITKYLCKGHEIEAIFIPPKEILSNAPGFRSLYEKREIAFEKTYLDIIDKAFLPPLKKGANDKFDDILHSLEKALGGDISQSGETFYLRTQTEKFEFMLLAEGLRKLGLLWLLIRNGSLAQGSVLCWDEPEANLNPKLMKLVVGILLQLQRLGVQVFLATHDYVLLKELDLQMKEENYVRFHALYREDKLGEICGESTDDYLQINPNAIADTFADLYDRDLDRALGEDG